MAGMGGKRTFRCSAKIKDWVEKLLGRIDSEILIRQRSSVDNKISNLIKLRNNIIRIGSLLSGHRLFNTIQDLCTPMPTPSADRFKPGLAILVTGSSDNRQPPYRRTCSLHKSSSNVRAQTDACAARLQVSVDHHCSCPQRETTEYSSPSAQSQVLPCHSAAETRRISLMIGHHVSQAI